MPYYRLLCQDNHPAGPCLGLSLIHISSIVISVVGGLCAAAVAWHVTGRRLSVAENPRAEALPNAEQNSQGILAVINSAGSDAIRLALGAVPMLILSLTIVGLLQGAGAIDLLQQLLKPLLSWLHIPQNFVLPALVKCVAGGTAYFGVISELIQQGKVTVDQVNASAGLLIQTFDLPGIGIFLGISSRFVRLFRFVAPAAIVGIPVSYTHLDVYKRQTQGECLGDPRPHCAVIARQEQVHLRHRREIHALPRAVAGADQVKVFFRCV